MRQQVNPIQIIIDASIEKAVTQSGTLGNTTDAQTKTEMVEMYTNDCLSPTNCVRTSSLSVICGMRARWLIWTQAQPTLDKTDMVI